MTFGLRGRLERATKGLTRSGGMDAPPAGEAPAEKPKDEKPKDEKADAKPAEKKSEAEPASKPAPEAVVKTISEMIVTIEQTQILNKG